jgi:hypothetical protein
MLATLVTRRSVTKRLTPNTALSPNTGVTLPNSEFNAPELRPNGELFVSGPFTPATSPGQHLEGEVTVRFLIHQHLQNQPEVIIDGSTSLRPPVAGDWTFTFPPGHGIQAGGVQCIGVMILRWDNDPPSTDNPGLEAYTWCVQRTVGESSAGA